jgi:hypothetical protein
MSLVRALVLVGLAACSSSPCEPELVVACPDCDRGEVRYALVGRWESSEDAINTWPEGGIADATCTAIIFFDASFHEQRRITFDAPENALSSGVALGGDDIYVLQADSRIPDTTPGENPLFSLIAYAADGHERWRKPRGHYIEFPRLVAGPEGPFPFDRDGVPRSLPGLISDDYPSIVRADGLGNDLVAYDQREPYTVSATIRTLDSAGEVRWTRTWQTHKIPPAIPAYLTIADAAVGPTGDWAVVGSFTGPTIDLGDRVLDVHDLDGGWFVVRLTADGAIAWAFVFAAIENLKTPRVAIAGDDVILGGQYRGKGAGLGLPDSDAVDSFLVVVDATGVVRANPLGGPGDQKFHSLRGGVDGTVTLALLNDTPSQLHIGSRTFQGIDWLQEFVINLRP